MANLMKEFLQRNRNKQLNIHCVGDAMVDEYFHVKVNRISPEFPMPIMASGFYEPLKFPGGAANTAYQLSYFNAACKLLCFSDPRALQVFKNHGLNVYEIRSPSTQAILPVKRRFLDNGVQVVRHDIEVPSCGLDYQSILRSHNVLLNYIRSEAIPDVVIFSDYDKGFFGLSSVMNWYPNSLTIVDPKSNITNWHKCTVFKPNKKEAQALTNLNCWRDQAKCLQNEINCEAVVITDGGNGVVGRWRNEFFEFKPFHKIQVKSVVGAGDCFAAILALAIGHNFTIPEAVEIAWHGGAAYVQKGENQPIIPSDLCLHQEIDPRDLNDRNYKLVFTNGCFDILHEGHIETLKFAKSKGDRLVVAINSDESIKRLKGPDRPIVPLRQRLAVLSQIQYVDYVVVFDEDTPLNVIEEIAPDVLVKGAEYEKTNIVGADIVDEIYQAPMVENISTSQILNNYLQSHLTQSH